jgi:branched-chain amino acid transport system ATP-binding protein
MTQAVLRAEHLVCRFGGLTAVADLSFEVAKGRIKAVIGPNGAGKSTLFNMIAGVIRPSGGRIWFDGERLDPLPPFLRAGRGIARTFQNLQIFRDMSLIENLMVGRHRHGGVGLWQTLWRGAALRGEERAIAAAAMALLEQFGLADKALWQAGSLSFGEMKMLELARALASEPRLLLLDEPAAGLPRAEADRMAEIITTLNRGGMTVLLVEHNMRMVMALAHDILVLNNGARIAEGGADAVRNHPDVIAAYLGQAEDA